MSRCSDITDNIFLEIGQPSTNANITVAQVTTGINVGYRKIWESDNWQWLLTSDNSKKLPYTTTATGTSTGTALYMTSISNLVAGQTLVIADTNYETVTTSTVASSPIALASPGLDGSYSSGVEIGGASISKPTDFYKIESVRIKEDDGDSYTLLKRITKRWLMENYPAIQTLGTPEYYYESDGFINFYPAADTTYRVLLNYFKVPAAISTTSDPEFATQWDDLLVYFGVYWFYNRVGETNKAMLFKAQFDEELRRMRQMNSYNYDDDVCFRLDNSL